MCLARGVGVGQIMILPHINKEHTLTHSSLLYCIWERGLLVMQWGLESVSERLNSHFRAITSMTFQIKLKYETKLNTTFLKCSKCIQGHHKKLRPFDRNNFGPPYHGL